MTTRPILERHFGRPAEQRAFANLRASIRRRKRRLLNSMKHIRNPRPADLERWRAWEAEIQKLEEIAAKQRPGGNDA